MVWFVVDDVLPFHERVIRAGNPAMGLWVRAGAYCSGQLTDGFVPAEVARTLGSPAEIRRLVDVGLWLTVEGGYLFHAWAEDGTGQKRQPTKAEVEEKRRKERERKARQRESHKDAAHLPASVPPPVPVGHPADVRPESQGASDYPYQTKPYQEEKDQEKRSPGGDLSSESDDSDPRSTALALVPEEQKSARSSSYGPTFERFWAAYPRHEGKRAAAAAFERAARRAPAAQIIDAATRYAADTNREDAYTAHPTTWLNRDGWDDAPLPKRRPETQYERLQANAEATHEALARMGIA